MPFGRWRRGIGLVVVATVGVTLGGCSSSSAPKADANAAATAAPAKPTTVGVTLKDFGVASAYTSVPSGSVTVSVKDSGAIPHEFVVVKSDLTVDKLPQFESKLVDGKQVQVVLKIAPLDAGKQQDVTVALQPGKYILLCNVASHFTSGMFTGFVVTSGGAPTNATPTTGAPVTGTPSNDGY